MIALDPFRLVFLIGNLLYLYLLLGPPRRRSPHGQATDRRETLLGLLLNFIGFFSQQLLPLVYILTPWLSEADYSLGGSRLVNLRIAIQGFGCLTFALSLWLLWRAHIELGQSWSGGVDIGEAHTLVTDGLYRVVRHPIYAAFWLWGFAQLLMLPNWVVGLAGMLGHMPNYFYRIPREEQMLLDHYGEAYQEYMHSTPRILPRLGGKR